MSRSLATSAAVTWPFRFTRMAGSCSRPVPVVNQGRLSARRGQDAGPVIVMSDDERGSEVTFATTTRARARLLEIMDRF
jgi:hypothetical protein